jgi:hypothetical protein
MSKAKILRNTEEIQNSAIMIDGSKFIRVVIRFVPQEQDFLLDMWANPEEYESCYLLPLLSDKEIILPPWFKHRADCCTECRIVDRYGSTLSYVELPEPVYLYKHYELLEQKKKKNFLRKLLHKIH